MNNNGFSEFEDIFNELKNKKIEELYKQETILRTELNQIIKDIEVGKYE